MQRGIEVVEFACGIAASAEGRVHRRASAPASTCYSMRQPLGVAAGITPFNFPAMIPLWMCALAHRLRQRLHPEALRARPVGCPDALAELFARGRPARRRPQRGERRQGGGGRASSTIPTSPRWASSARRRSREYIYRDRPRDTASACRRFGGAKNHMIVMPDADLDQAADALIGAGYGSAGERCMAISVAVPVGERPPTRWSSGSPRRSSSCKVGPGTEPRASTMGPLVTAAARASASAATSTPASSEGAKLVVDGRGFKLQGYENGFFVGRRLFDHVTPRDDDLPGGDLRPGARRCVRADTYDEALEPRQRTTNTATAPRSSPATATRRATSPHEVEVGMVGINVPIPVPLAYHTFGGWKRSLLRRPATSTARTACASTPRTKTITSRWPSGIKEGSAFNFKAMDGRQGGGRERPGRPACVRWARPCGLDLRPRLPDTKATHAGAAMTWTDAAGLSDISSEARSRLDALRPAQIPVEP
ncbi:MAG: aldehyde dehydrogenase family protein [Rhodopseudomonas palustris]|nr:aldehyde dehydrogenase family protein [Rhodopseudomonas palustris]